MMATPEPVDPANARSGPLGAQEHGVVVRSGEDDPALEAGRHVLTVTLDERSNATVRLTRLVLVASER